MGRASKTLRIGILGGGYAGLRMALDLAHLRRHGSRGPDLEVELVERASHHRVIFWMHQVAAGSLTSSQASLAYARLPLEGIGFRRAEIHRIDPETCTVKTSQGDCHYDVLVLALGSLPAHPPIPGLAEYAHTLRDQEEAEALQVQLEATFAQAGRTTDPNKRRRLACIVVAGGGYTGCQLAGELAHSLPKLADRHGISVRDIRLILMESQKRLLPGRTWGDGYCAQRILEEKGVEVRTKTPLERVDETQLVAGGLAIRYGLLAWAGGIRGPEVLRRTDLEQDKNGRVRVDSVLAARGYPAIRAIGDCAVREDDPSALATAAEAINQGRYLAGTLWREAEGRDSAPYRPSRLGLLVALGNADAVGTIGPIPVCGRGAGIVKNATERTYPETLTGTGWSS